MTQFNSQNHRIGFVRTPHDSRSPSQVKVVRANIADIEQGIAAVAPLETLGDVTTTIARIPIEPRHPWRGEKSSSGAISSTEIADSIKALHSCQAEHRKLWAVERKILLRLYNQNAHAHPSISLKSFQQFLTDNFDKTTAYRYLKEIATGRREEILGVEIGTYSHYQFKPLERFRCHRSKGSTRDEKGAFRSGSAQFGVKLDLEQIQRLKECWEIACRISNSKKPKAQHILLAVEEMAFKYPEYSGRKEISSVRKWKRRALEAEALIVVLKEDLMALKKQLAAQG